MANSISTCFNFCQAIGETVETTVYAVKLITDNPLTKLVQGVVERYGNFFDVYDALIDEDGVNFFEDRKVSKENQMISDSEKPKKRRITKLVLSLLEMVKIVELVQYLPSHSSLKFLAPVVSVVSGPSVAFTLQVLDIIGSALQVKTTFDDAADDEDKSFWAKAEYTIKVIGNAASAAGGAGIVVSIFLPSPTAAITAPVSAGVWMGGTGLLAVGSVMYVVRKRNEIYGDVKKTVTKIVNFASDFFRQFYYASFPKKVEFTAKVMGFSMLAGGAAAAFVSMFVPPIGAIVIPICLTSMQVGGGSLLAGGVLHVVRKREQIKKDIMKVINSIGRLTGLSVCQKPAESLLYRRSNYRFSAASA